MSAFNAEVSDKAAGILRKMAARNTRPPSAIAAAAVRHHQRQLVNAPFPEKRDAAANHTYHEMVPDKTRSVIMAASMTVSSNSESG